MKISILRNVLKIIVLIIVMMVFIIAVKLWLLKRDVNRFADYWQQRASEQYPDNALTYVALGDSAAQGLGASRPEFGYVGLLADALQVKTNRPVKVINLSKTGARISNVIDNQLPALKKLVINSEAVITLEIGANEMRTYEPKAFERDMNELLAQMPKQTVVADIPYFGGGRYRQLEQHARSANEQITKLTEKYQLRLAPLHQITQEKDTWWVNSVDLFHPSNRGYRNWFEAFWRVLK